MEAKPRRNRRVMLTGDFEHCDFAGVLEFLASCENVQVDQAALLDVPVGCCDVIALCQSRPGKFTQAEVEQLHARSPLANLLAILGSWCEGELRSGRPWHGVDRVYWYNAVGRLQWLLDSDGGPAAFRTCTAAERIEASAMRWRAVAAGQSAAICTLRRHEYESLADVCRALGFSAHWQQSWQVVGAAPTVLLVALDDLQASVPGELCNAWPDTRRIALLNFPRRSEVVQLRQAGFHHVLGKPLLITDLLGCLPEMWGPAAQRQMAAS